MECPICFDSIQDLFMIKAPCAHSICLGCFVSLKEIACPFCRAPWRSQLPRSYVKATGKTRPNGSLDLNNTEEFPPLGT